MILTINSKYVTKFQRSREIYESIKDLIPGGVNSWTRTPIYFTRGKGPRIWDVDGNEYIDLCCDWGACILGHGYIDVQEYVKEKLENGLTIVEELEITTEVAKKINQIVPSAECVKFSNTGSEAVMHALQIARGYTGKNKLVKLEGGFNGWVDIVYVSIHPNLEKAGAKNQPNSVLEHIGVDKSTAQNTIIMPFNDIDASVKIITKHKDELAAVLMEPVVFSMGCVLPDREYLRAIREVTDDWGIPLIFDEVITGFRLAPGGAQQFYGVTPDITTLGKAIANGFPLSAVVGRKEIMQLTDPKRRGAKPYVPFGGTYNANQVGIAAAKATLERLENGEIQNYLHESTVRLEKNFNEIAGDLDINAHIQQIAGKFQVYLTDQEIVDYRTALKHIATDEKIRKFNVFSQSLFDSGLFWLPNWNCHHGITAAHTQREMEITLQNMTTALENMKKTQ